MEQIMNREFSYFNNLPHVEKANALTHGIGALLGMAGLAALLFKAYPTHDFWAILSAWIFGGSLILLYTASTLYHSVTDPKLKHIMRVLDHSSIYVLIAGTYTPLLMVTLRDRIHVWFIIIIWAIALWGIIYKLFWTHKFPHVSTILYLAMGWMAVIKIKTIYQSLPVQALVLLGAGGLFYTFGTYFYTVEKLKYHHAIWHLFVMAGSICHFFAIYLYVY